nr:unnamed protein product [Naegleria fowleri]
MPLRETVPITGGVGEGSSEINPHDQPTTTATPLTSLPYHHNGNDRNNDRTDNINTERSSFPPPFSHDNADQNNNDRNNDNNNINTVISDDNTTTTTASTRNNTNQQHMISSSIPTGPTTPTPPPNSSTIFNNEFFQNQEVRRHAQAIALNIIRFVFRASPFVTRYLEELCYFIGMLLFVSLVLLHSSFYISPNNLANPSQQSLLMSTLTKSEIVTNHVQQIKLMRIFSSQEAQNLTKHFPPLLRTALFGIDFHGFNLSTNSIYDDHNSSNFFKSEHAQLLTNVSLEKSTASQIQVTNMLEDNTSVRNIIVTQNGKVADENFTLSPTSSLQADSVQPPHDIQVSTHQDLEQGKESSVLRHTSSKDLEISEKTAVPPSETQHESKEDTNYFERTQKILNLLGNALLDIFIRPFSVKPRVTCLENRIMEKYRGELIKRYENRTDTLTAASVHSFLLRLYIEGPIDKMMREWERELSLKKTKSQPFKSDTPTSQLDDTNSQSLLNAQQESSSSELQSQSHSENAKKDTSQQTSLKEKGSTTNDVSVDTPSSGETEEENNSDEWSLSLDHATDAIKSWILFKYQHSPLFTDIFNDTRLFVYTTEKGLFYISRETKQTLSIPSYTISIDWNDSCFDILGGSFPYLLSFLIGYDTTILNTFVQYNYDFNHNYTINSGVLYSRQYDEIYYLKYGQVEMDAISRGISKIAPLILNVFFVQRMARSFMVHLFQNLMFVPVLLGVIHFIDNFFSGDQKASLLVFCLIWISQIFMNNVCNSRFSKAVFPWVLHFYCSTYFIYYFSHPHGYSYLAFSTLFSVIVQKMLYLWNTCEYNYIVNHHPILRDILGTGGGNANNDDFDIFDRINAMVHQRNGIPSAPRIQNVQQFVFNLSDMNNGHAIEQQIGRFNISISLAQNNNTASSHHAPSNTTPTH